MTFFDIASSCYDKVKDEIIKGHQLHQQYLLNEPSHMLYASARRNYFLKVSKLKLLNMNNTELPQFLF